MSDKAPRTIEIPVGSAVALVDAADAHLAELRWQLTPKGYAVREVGPRKARKALFMHRAVLGLPNEPSIETDHINGHRLDNRRSNLRVGTRAENAQNLLPRGGTSSYRGVCWDSRQRKWLARTKLNQRTRGLGRYRSELEAARAAEAFRRTHMPFARWDESLEPVPACPCAECRS